MYSFYGGRPGNSFIIITSFPSVDDMIKEFSQGPTYTDVHFDEHVLINTENKNDPDNGKIFRRGYNYKDELGGAVQIGQIVGPAGPAPTLSLGDYKTISEDSTISSERINEKEGSYNINSSLVPGYDKQHNEYNDEIKWVSYSIRTIDNGECQAYIGFKIPYLVMDWQAKSISAYEDPTIEEKKEQGQSEHPFYKKWELGITKGKNGTSLSNLRIKEYNRDDDRDLKTADGQAYEGTEEGKHIIIYDQTLYDTETPIITQKYLGNYNIIQNISHENGKLLIKCTNDNNPQEFLINEIESIDLNSETGQFSIKYFNNENPTTFTLKWVKDVDFNETNGTLVFKYANSVTQEKVCPINWIKGAEIKEVNLNDSRQFLYLNWVNPIDGDSTETQLSNFRWVKELNLTENGILQATYNDNITQNLNTPQTAINWVESIRVNPDTHALQCVTNNNKTYDISIENGVKWITSTQINENGILTINYNAGNPDVLSENPIKWIDSINLSEDGSLTINYNTEETQTITEKIRWIQNTTMDGSGNIIVEYNDDTSDSFGPLKFIDNVTINEDNHLMITYSNSQEPVDIGSVAANLPYPEPYVYGLNWSGIGQIVVLNTGEEVQQTIKYLNFTASITSLIADSEIIFSGYDNLFAALKTNQSQISFGQSLSVSVEKSLTGLNFMIEIPEEGNSTIYEGLTNGTLVDVFISGVDLQFIEQ